MMMNMKSDGYEEIGTGKKPLSKLSKIIIIACIISAILLVILLVILFVFVLNPKPIQVSIARTLDCLYKWSFYPNLTRISHEIDAIDFSNVLPDTIPVTSPHTWNNFDGQNGNEYARYPCSYQQIVHLDASKIANNNFYLEFCGSNLKTIVYIDGEKVGMHVGGYTKFRFDITNYVKTEFVLTVVVDNRNDREYYPMSADFTFFGGIYRNVHLVSVGKTAFHMTDYGSTSFYITTNASTGEMFINISYTTESSNIHPKIRYSIIDPVENKIISQTTTKELPPGSNTHSITGKIANPHLWDGLNDPFLYIIQADLIVDNTVVDRIETKFGFRTIEINTTGCFLNGRKYQLRGVSRHQDRLDKGWAISNEDEKEDLDLIYELGANVLRLAHYPQNATVYDYCDEKGIIVICEIPFISKFLDTEQSLDNLKIQLTEMIKQNFNHPSVALWGIMNELGQTAESDNMMKSIEIINTLAKSLDPSRKTYGAILQETLPTSRMVPIADVIGYNLYGGWYIGNTELNRHIIEQIKSSVPTKPLALTEYGAEGILKWHSENPVKRDYTEEYQLQFHEKVYKIIEEMDLWGSFVWNMFDFASSNRNEGGVKGRNNKGLVTYDRKTKKDSFYLYKSFLNSRGKFVHICGQRFHDRADSQINLSIITSKTIFNNTLEVYVNNKVVAIENTQKHLNIMPITLNNGMNYIRAVVYDPSSKVEIASDQCEFEKVDEPNPDYIFYNASMYDDIYPHPVGFYSVLDSMKDIHDSNDAWKVFTDEFNNKLDINDFYPYLVEDRGIDFLTFGAGTLPQATIFEMNRKLNDIAKQN